MEQNGHLRAWIWVLIEGSALAMSEMFVRRKKKEDWDNHGLQWS